MRAGDTAAKIGMAQQNFALKGLEMALLAAHRRDELAQRDRDIDARYPRPGALDTAGTVLGLVGTAVNIYDTASTWFV